MIEKDLDAPPLGLETSDFVLHLWRRTWIILGLTALTFVATYLALRVFADNIFETRALLMVRQQPRLTQIERDQVGIDPPSFRGMFTSDHTLDFVRQQYNGWAKGQDPTELPEVNSPIEKLRDRFSATSITTVDTTISTVYSPVIELRVKGTTPGQSRALMEMWVQHLLRKYGNLLSDEAQFLVDSSRRRAEELRVQVEAAALVRATVATELEAGETRLLAKRRQLTLARVPSEPTGASKDVMGFLVNPGTLRSAVNVTESQAGETPGLYERRTDLEIRLAGMKAAPEGREIEIAMAQAELGRINEMIPRIEADIAELSTAVAELRAKLAGHDAELTRLEYAVSLNATVGSQAEGVLRSVTKPADDAEPGDDAFSTLRILSQPVTPNLRVWPKRSLVAAGAAIAMLAALLMLFCFELYLKRAIQADEERKRVA